jgi:hypothetical protein
MNPNQPEYKLDFAQSRKAILLAALFLLFFGYKLLIVGGLIAAVVYYRNDGWPQSWKNKAEDIKDNFRG